MPQPFLPLDFRDAPKPSENRGAIYTKPWVVELLLDLAGYRVGANLVDTFAVEPAAGQGAFLIAMARRLIASCAEQGRAPIACLKSLAAYEIDEASAQTARFSLITALTRWKLDESTAQALAESWVRAEDYLIAARRLPLADFVVGNPPYIRHEEIPTEAAAFYRSAYQTMTGRADLYVAFFEAALDQLRDGGVCAFICADRWMRNQYGSDLRRFITSRFQVRTIIEMHNADAFDEEVSAYPALTIIRRGIQGRVVVATAGAPIGPTDSQALAELLQLDDHDRLPEPTAPIQSSAVVDGWFRGHDPWPCGSPNRLELVRRLEHRFPTLEDGNHTRVGIGVATGRDSVYITRNPGLVEADRLLPIALASDTTTGRLRWSGHYLVDPWTLDGLVDLDDHPRLRAYFETHRDSLTRRHTARRRPDDWYRTIDRVNHALKDRAKLYVPDIKDRLNPVLDQGKTYPHHNLYFVISDIWNLEVLGGILLSSVAQMFMESYGVRMRGGYLRFQAQYLRRVRVPNPGEVGPAEARELVEAFRTRDRGRATAVALRLYAIGADELEAVHGP